MHPEFKLSRLREIGWSCWDPIGLAYLLDEGSDSAADEYDSYLLEAADKLWNGAAAGEVAAYLVQIEADHMGLGERQGSRERAAATAGALADYVENMRRG